VYLSGNWRNLRIKNGMKGAGNNMFFRIGRFYRFDMHDRVFSAAEQNGTFENNDP
jgi:hypothetical protein